MPHREFEIMIGKDGEVELRLKGFKGRACHDTAKMFEKIIGEIKSEQATTESYEPEEQVQHRVDQRH